MATPMAGGQTPATLRLAGIESARAPSLERRSVVTTDVTTAERSTSRPARRPSSSDAPGAEAPADAPGSGPSGASDAPGSGPSAEFYERAGDLAKAERLYAPQEAAEMYLRHKMVGEAVRLARAGAGVS